MSDCDCAPCITCTELLWKHTHQTCCYAMATATSQSQRKERIHCLKADVSGQGCERRQCCDTDGDRAELWQGAIWISGGWTVDQLNPCSYYSQSRYLEINHEISWFLCLQTLAFQIADSHFCIYTAGHIYTCTNECEENVASLFHTEEALNHTADSNPVNVYNSGWLHFVFFFFFSFFSDHMRQTWYPQCRHY